MDRLTILLRQVEREVERAKTHGPFHSAHEGYAVILEELDELWEEVRKNRKVRSVTRMRSEAIQVAATALKFILTVCDPVAQVEAAMNTEGAGPCDCTICKGTGFVGPDYECCECIRMGCRMTHSQNPPGGAT